MRRILVRCLFAVLLALSALAIDTGFAYACSNPVLSRAEECISNEGPVRE